MKEQIVSFRTAKLAKEDSSLLIYDLDKLKPEIIVTKKQEEELCCGNEYIDGTDGRCINCGSTGNL